MEQRAPSPKEEQNSWQYKGVLALRGNQTLAGCILLYLIGVFPKRGRRILGPATVDEHGLTWVQFQNQREQQGVVCIGLITDIRDEFRRLSDHLKLDDAERIELFDELRKFVALDMRNDADKGVRLN